MSMPLNLTFCTYHIDEKMIPDSFIYANIFLLNCDALTLKSPSVLFHVLQQIQMYPYCKIKYVWKEMHFIP